MDTFQIFTLVLASFSILAIIVSYFKYAERVSALERKVDDLAKTNLKSLTTLKESLVENHKSALDLHTELVKTFTGSHSDLPSDWLEHLKTIPDKSFYQKIEEYGYALIRHPGNVEIFNGFFDLLKENYSNQSLSQRSDLLKSFEVMLRRFFETCDRKSLSLKEKYFTWFDNECRAYKKLVIEERMKSNVEHLEAFKSFVADCKKRVGFLGQDDFQKLQFLESRIDQELIKVSGDLKQAKSFEATSNLLLETLKQNDQFKRLKEENDTKNYNEQALDIAKSALSDFRNAKKGPNLTKVAEKLGGIEDGKLLTPVAVYKNAIFSEIFKEIGESDKREAFVRNMINQSKAS